LRTPYRQKNGHEYQDAPASAVRQEGFAPAARPPRYGAFPLILVNFPDIQSLLFRKPENIFIIAEEQPAV